MTLPGPCPAQGHRLLSAVRTGGAVTAAVALAALVAIGPPGTARAASGGNGYNQITGEGTTASVAIVSWKSGLLDSSNQPISTPGSELNPNSDRSSGTGSLSFMDADFENLQVTVSQTQGITHQAITVSWKGMAATQIQGTAQIDFLQMMECYGDSSTGPSPEDCEYGSSGLLQSGSTGTPNNPQIGTRTGDLCPPGSKPNTQNPPGPSLTGIPGDAGCDPFEPTSETPSHCWPNAPAGNACTDGLFDIPFVPVDSQSPPIYDPTQLGQYFNEFDTNEVQQAITGQNKQGQLQFQALTRVQSQGLGCGEPDNGRPRGCWLVIVPRGGYEPNGFNVGAHFGIDHYLYTSPLSAANWAQRIQIHLDYDPLQISCSNNPPTLSIEGTQLISKAVSSWQLALNRAANCSLIYQYGESFETQTTTDLSTGADGIGFTTIPIGSEASRYPGEPPPPKLPSLLYAPVAVTGLGFGFNISDGLGFTTTAVNLTPSLAAKALTQVYRTDLPTYSGSVGDAKGPAWSQNNPLNITGDSAFQKINSPSVIKAFGNTGQPIEPLTTLDHSAVNQQLWQWIQSDSATVTWLDGGKDPSNSVTADPEYVKFKLGKSPAADNYPQDFTDTISCVKAQLNDCGPNGSATLTTQDLLPQYLDFDTAASSVLAANDKSLPLGSWSPNTLDPGTGVQGYWTAVGVEPPGQIFMWTVADLPDIARYGLIPADLCAPSGTNCVAPSVASVTKTLNSATTDSQGLVEINPAKIPSGGYPLVDVVYAAVPTNQKAADLTAYANLIKYAVTQGQTEGSALGDLPPGYLPLTSALQTDALRVVAKLQALANPTPSHSPTTPTHSATTQTTTQAPPATRTQSTTPTSSASTTPTSSTSPTPAVGASATPTTTRGGAGLPTSSSPSTQGPVTLAPSAELAGGTTPRQSPGPIRWALIAVLIIGAAGVLGGTVLRSGRMPRWLIRGRT
jgi:hypothetical protein